MSATFSETATHKLLRKTIVRASLLRQRIFFEWVHETIKTYFRLLREC